jgi:hypothetical protein
MPDLQDAQNMLEALAATGATTVVAAMGTDAWQAARAGTARLFRRRGAGRQELVVAQLDDDAALAERAEDPARVREVLAGPWRLRLAALLREYPEAAVELRALIEAVSPQLSASRQATTQINNSHGGMLFAVQDGDQHNHFMDLPPAVDGGESE